jgi:hypothetical protein
MVSIWLRWINNNYVGKDVVKDDNSVKFNSEPWNKLCTNANYWFEKWPDLHIHMIVVYIGLWQQLKNCCMIEKNQRSCMATFHNHLVISSRINRFSITKSNINICFWFLKSFYSSSANRRWFWRLNNTVFPCQSSTKSMFLSGLLSFIWYDISEQKFSASQYPTISCRCQYVVWQVKKGTSFEWYGKP